MGRHVCMFVVDDVLSKLKGFSCNKGKVIEVIVRIGSSLNFHREKDLFLSSSKKQWSCSQAFRNSWNYYVNKCLRSRRWILLKVTCEGEMSYQYQLVYLLYCFLLIIIVRNDHLELCERSKTCAKRPVRKVFCAKCPVFVNI